MQRSLTVLFALVLLVSLTACGGGSGLATAVDQRGYLMNPYGAVHGITAAAVRAIARPMRDAGDSQIWVAGNDGLYLAGAPGNAITFTRHTTVDGLNDNNIFALAVDPVAKLYVGTGLGMCWLAYGQASFTAIPGGVLPSAGRVTAIAAPTTTELWAGIVNPASLRAVVAFSANGAGSFADRTSNLVASEVSHVFVDDTGTYLSTQGTFGGVYHYESGNWRSLGLPNASGAYFFTRIEGVMYACTPNGMYYSSNNALSWSADPNFTDRKVYFLQRDPRGRVFIGTDVGLSIGFGVSQWRSYTIADRLPSNAVATALLLNDSAWLGCVADASGNPGGVVLGVYTGD